MCKYKFDRIQTMKFPVAKLRWGLKPDNCTNTTEQIGYLYREENLIGVR